MTNFLELLIFGYAIVTVSSFIIRCAKPYTCEKISECKKIHGNKLHNFIFRFCGHDRFDEVCCPQFENKSPIVFVTESETEVTINETTVTTTVATVTTTLSPKFQLAMRFLPTETCGWKNVTLDNKVYEGRNAAPGEFPWIVLLKMEKGQTRATCGGTLISELYVVTAAHCLYFYDHKSIQLTLGAADFKGEISCSYTRNEKPIIRRAEKVIVHEKYYEDKQLFGGKDIGLIRMNEPIEFNVCIQPACLPFGNFGKGLSREKSLLVTGGWGTKGRSSRPSKLLQIAEQYFVNGTDCATRYREQKYSISILSSQICTLGKRNARGLKGDSGGPLLSERFMRRGSNSGITYILVGVMSSGPADWNKTNAVPNIYTKVNRFLGWILDKLEP